MDSCTEHSAHARAIEQHDKRLDSHGEQLDDIRETLAALREIERQNQQRLDAQDERIAALEAKPSKRWETATNYVLTAGIALLMGYIAATAGIS